MTAEELVALSAACSLYSIGGRLQNTAFVLFTFAFFQLLIFRHAIAPAFEVRNGTYTTKVSVELYEHRENVITTISHDDIRFSQSKQKNRNGKF